MTQDNFLGEMLSDPAVIAQVAPLLNAAIDARIAPINEQLEQLTRGVTLIAEATVAQANGQAPPQAQAPPMPPQASYAPPEAPPAALMNGTPPQAPYSSPGAATTGAVDKLAAFAPMLMQYLSGQQQGNSLGNIAETLSAAAQIGNFVNGPMWQGMEMATKMMSMAGRAGIEPSSAADALGGMIEDQRNNGVGAAPAGQNI